MGVLSKDLLSMHDICEPLEVFVRLFVYMVVASSEQLTR